MQEAEPRDGLRPSLSPSEPIAKFHAPLPDAA